MMQSSCRVGASRNVWTAASITTLFHHHHVMTRGEGTSLHYFPATNTRMDFSLLLLSRAAVPSDNLSSPQNNQTWIRLVETFIVGLLDPTSGLAIVARYAMRLARLPSCRRLCAQCRASGRASALCRPRATALRGAKYRLAHPANFQALASLMRRNRGIDTNPRSMSGSICFYTFTFKALRKRPQV